MAWRSDAFHDGSDFIVTKDVCTNCGYTFQWFTSGISVMPDIHEHRRRHETHCLEDRVRCKYRKVGAKHLGARRPQCILPDGHPVGPQFNWFTDEDGHMFDLPEPVQPHNG